MTKLSNYAVGNIVKLNVNGAARNFIIIHHGKPSTSYDSSCDGTWLLIEDIYEKRVWGSNSDYANSSIHSYLNNEFLEVFDSDIKSVIKQVKIPYAVGGGTSSVATGANGLPTRVFLLTRAELGYSSATNYATVGAAVAYFKSASNSKRIAYLAGSANSWLLRSPYGSGAAASSFCARVSKSGGAEYGYVTDAGGIRPALILPSKLVVDDSGNVTSQLASSLEGNVTVGGAQKELVGGYVNIGGTWKEITKAYINIGGTWKE